MAINLIIQIGSNETIDFEGAEAVPNRGDTIMIDSNALIKTPYSHVTGVVKSVTHGFFGSSQHRQVASVELYNVSVLYR